MSRNHCKHCGAPLYSKESEFCCAKCETAWNLSQNAVEATQSEQTIFIDEELFKDCTISNGDQTCATFYVTNIKCAACVQRVEKVIRKLKGVSQARVNYATYITKVDYDPSVISLKSILERVTRAGHNPVPDNPINVGKEKKDLLMRFAVGSFFTMQLMLYAIALYAGYFQDMSSRLTFILQIISWALTTPVMFYTGMPFIKNSINNIRNKTVSMDVLVLLGAGSAYIYSIFAIFMGKEVYFDTTATILTLITLGRYIEASAKEKAKSGMFNLFTLTPPYARIIVAGGCNTVPLSKVETGMLLQVLPGDKVPVDGVIREGHANIDESMLTGEALPISKSVGQNVFAGTLNTDGQFIMAAESVGKDTVLSQIIKAIESADLSKTKIINFADKIASIFVPSVILIALATFIVRVTFIEDLSSAIMHSVAVLVVACPCALGLAMPLAVTIALSSATSIGAVIKNGDIFEVLTKITSVYFDKTGTLTIGKPSVEEVITVINPEQFDYLVSSVESKSNHILAKAIINRNIALGEVSDFKEDAGQGVAGNVDDNLVAVGRYSFIKSYMKQDNPELYQKMMEASKKGRSVVNVSINGEFAGFYAITDPLREDSIKTIHNLKDKYKLSLLSGDNEAMVASISGELGISYQAELSPFAKADYIKRSQNEGECVLMVGDGINDAPALKQADGGIAVGQTASDIAVGSADGVIIRPDLSILESLISIARYTKKIIKQNLFWAFAYNVIAIPLAATGYIHPIVSAISMSISSIIVVLNSLRIKVNKV